MEAHKQWAVMFFHGLAGRRWCGGLCSTYSMPYLRHTVGAECRENKVPFFRYAVFAAHCRCRGFSPEIMCRAVRGNGNPWL